MPKAGWSLALEQRTRDVAPTARAMVEARVEAAADVRQRTDQWQGADTVIDPNLEFLSDGGVRLKATAGAAFGPSVVTSSSTFYRAKEGAVAAPYIDPWYTGLGVIAVLMRWRGSAANATYGGVQCWLQPRYDVTKPKYIKTWVFSLFRLSGFLSQQTLTTVTLVPLLTAQADAAGEVAGWVVFNFVDATGKPITFHPDRYLGSNNDLPDIYPNSYYAMVTGFDRAGKPATNIGWGYDNTQTNFVQGSGSNDVRFAGNQIRRLTQGSAVAVTIGLQHIPAIQFIPHTYAASATITFKTTNPIDLGSTPATPPELVVRAELPAGTSITPQAAVDPAGAFTTFADGQTTAAIGLATQRKYDMRCTLNASADGSRSPILRALGARVVTTADLSDLCEVSSWSEKIDPITHTSEIGEIVFRVAHDGERDYKDAITQLLSQNPLATLALRVFWGERRLAKSQWLHLDDVMIEDQRDVGGALEVTGVSVLSLLKQALPVLRADLIAVPTADASNPGVWTASAGTDLFAQIADITATGASGLPDDTGYIQSPVNPTIAAYSATLGALSTPPQTVGAVIQCRAAVATAGQSLNLKIQVRDGGTVRATLNVTVNVADTGQGSYTPFQYRLTAAEQASISNWANLNFNIIANGTGQIRVSWARLVVLGLRSPLVYPSSATPANTVAGCMTDLIQNQIALDGRYQGPRYVDPTPALPAAKIIASDSGGSTDLSRAKLELDALAMLAGSAFISDQGRLVCVPLYQVVSGVDPITGTVSPSFSPLQGPIQFVIPNEEIADPITCTPGWRQRVPIFAVPWGWNGQAYAGEAQATNGLTLASVPLALIDTEGRPSTAIAQWIAGDGLARAIAIRHVQAFGLGLAVWRFRSTYPHPELRLGDVGSIAVTRFVAYDPIGNRAIAGQVWATGVLVGRYDAAGTDLELWVQSYTLLSPIATSALRKPELSRVSGFRRDGHLWIQWQGLNTLSVKVATVAAVDPTTFANNPYPDIGTGTSDDTGLYDAGAFDYTATILVTVTPYAEPGAAGIPGSPYHLIGQAGPIVQRPISTTDPPPLTLPSGGDLVINGGFEDGFGHWSNNIGNPAFSGVVALETGSPYKGTASLKVTGSGSGPVVVRQLNDVGTNLYIPVVPGDRFRLFATAKLDSSGSVSSGVEVDGFDGSFSPTTAVGSVLWKTETTYTPKTVDFIVPAGTYYLNVSVIVGATSAQTLTADEIHCYRQATDNPEVTLTDAATIAVDAALSDAFTVTLTAGGHQVGAPTHLRQGQTLTFRIVQDGTGGRALTWNAVFKTNWSDAGNTLNKQSLISFYCYDGTNLSQKGAQGPYV